MNEITEALYAQKVRELSEAIEVRDSIITVLVWEIGKGKNVSISKGKQKQASETVGAVGWRTLSSGELRITVEQREKESKS